MDTTFEGSRKHLLCLIDPNYSAYPQTMNTLLRGHAQITNEDRHEPVGQAQVSESEIPDFCARHCPDLVDPTLFNGWWLPVQSPRPRGATWDLLSTCSVGDRRGLLLVEAKAHAGELTQQGKSLDPDASLQSHTNHAHIAACLAAVETHLRKSDLSVHLGVKSHYQLANRIAWAWKLADCGVPVVLLYLGFLGDTHFTDHFKDANHWQRTMGAYMDGIVPLDLPGRSIQGRNGGSFTLLVESLPLPYPTTITDIRTVGMSDQKFRRVLDQVGEDLATGLITDEVLDDSVFDLSAEDFLSQPPE